MGPESFETDKALFSLNKSKKNKNCFKFVIYF